MNPFRFTVGSAVLSTALIVVAGCDRQNGAGGAPAGGAPGGGGAAGGPPAPAVMVAMATARDVPVYLDRIGNAQAIESVMITPRIAGQIIDRAVQDGAFVKKDQVLFHIDPRPTQAALASAQAQLAQAKAAVDFARIELDRYQAVAGTQAVSKSDLDTRRNAVDVAVAQQGAAEAAVNTAQLNLDYCTIRSPIDGRAGAVLVDVGNVVKENETSLLSVQRLDPVYVNFTINESQLAEVRENMANGSLVTEARLPADSGPPHHGSLTFVDNAVQGATGTVELRATLPNADAHFWPGQFVQVRLILRTLKDAILVPSAAPQLSQSGPYVIVVKPDNIAEMRPIVAGQTQGDQVVITKGLAAGEHVVVDGQLMVRPGAPVRPQAATQPTTGQAAGTASSTTGGGTADAQSAARSGSNSTGQSTGQAGDNAANTNADSTGQTTPGDNLTNNGTSNAMPGAGASTTGPTTTPSRESGNAGTNGAAADPNRTAHTGAPVDENHALNSGTPSGNTGSNRP